MDSSQPNFNLVVLAGMLAAPPDMEPHESASSRLLLTVRSFHPAPRIDLVPVSVSGDQIPDCSVNGDRLWVVGSLQRRFSPVTGRSRLEVAAHHVEPQTIDGLIGADL